MIGYWFFDSSLFFSDRYYNIRVADIILGGNYSLIRIFMKCDEVPSEKKSNLSCFVYQR